MENDNLRFLDLANYLSQGTSYAQFRASFADSASKGFWPYHYWQICINWIQSMLGTTPDEIEHNYKIVKDCWETERMWCLRDLIVKYQLDDVKPMIVGIENMLGHYKEKCVCIFFKWVFLLRVSKILMHRSAEKSNSYFPLFDKLSSDLELLFQRNVNGGL